MTPQPTSSASGAHHFLQGLTDLGIEHVFSNLGTDHVSLIEELAHWDAQGRAHPQFILCPHENVAVHMAAGYAALTGRGQAVMVHVDAGTANAVMGMHNMLRARLPVMLLAGKAPFTLRGELPGSRDNYVHFVQDPFDIGSLVRPYVKWEYNLPTAVVAREALRRAHTVMHSEPPGPVFMTLPREVLAEQVSATDQAFDAQRYGPSLLGGIDAERAQRIADRLLAAQQPVVITSYLGRKAEAVAALEVAHVNLVVAVFIWVMIYPMMIQIDLASIKDVGHRPRGLVLTLVINWLVKPFTMALLAVLFFEHVFASWVDPKSAQEYIAGMILLGVAPCTAMVFVWSQLVKGDAAYTLVQVSVNDLIMVFAFAPIAAFLLGVTDVTVPWQTLALSTVLYVVLPLVAGVLTRHLWLRAGGAQRLARGVAALKPWSVVGLIATVVLLFGFQARTLIEQPLVILMIAVPLVLQSYGIFAISYAAAWKLRLPFDVAAPACMIGTSNFFELAVAVAISLFGLNSGAALATVVGVLVEVPVMLSVCAGCNRTRHWFPVEAV
jgi:ACR3 family arsenite transporter